MKINIEGGEEKEFQPGSTVGEILETFGLMEKNVLGPRLTGPLWIFGTMLMKIQTLSL